MDSLPQAFQQQIERQLKGDFQKFSEALKEVSPTSIRHNPFKTAETACDSPVPWAKAGCYLKERPVFTLDPLFHAGKYYVQEASSMFLEQAIKKTTDADVRLKVLDLCAAPGGKSTHLLSLINRESLLVSNEVIRPRASVLSENIQKWGYPNCLVTNNDPEDFSSLSGFFDLIVLDAPCSGEGLFRKDPQAMNQWSPENVALCTARQKRILHDAWPALKEDGILIYCTCTYNEAENENNLLALSENYELEFIDLSPDPSWNIETVSKRNVIGYRFFPQRLRGEGFFISAMRKKGSSGIFTAKKRSRLVAAPKKFTDTLNSWIINPEAFRLFQHNDLIFTMPDKNIADIEMLLQHLKFVYGGTNLATAKHDKLIPEHALAVSTILNREAFHVVDVDEKTAIQYLRRETIVLNENTKGFALLTFEQTPIGWVNLLQNRVNNLYPQEWRIRMAPL
jgi:16S rRNA C967 or C1407 C5-methylase (RsmB/RsmF family)/NOL1/NOP2/fmu family ribosome biogenesis protein